ncbi:PREDICTED: uncharacterized protein LOC105360418 [Ceratosolen solmsi marchali]|uniref:Uncharacterized protein LOC105360418 n=1 Tax=Ceratosolen solmsi marchali TaxID=326594 RepID=A0AAJ6VN27_9HYME|nr:PREDICTED: uncharacterized protein LOC105360418 [Ceratosolen solmsi marchali]
MPRRQAARMDRAKKTGFEDKNVWPVLTKQPVSVYKGVTFANIVRYVARRLRMPVTTASAFVHQVLRAGIVFGKIEKLPDGMYRLINAKPPGLVCKIEDTWISEDECSSNDTSESE